MTTNCVSRCRPVRLVELPERLINVKCPVTCIGVMEAQPGLRVRDEGRARAISDLERL